LFDALERDKGEGDVATVTIDGVSVTVYVPSKEAAQRVVKQLRVECESLGVEPVGVEADRWIAEESRWSGEARERRESSSGLDLWDVWSLVDALFFWWP
jgi:hypothetical protein